MKKYFTLILLVLLPIVANAYDAEIDGIYYNFSGDEATVTYKNYLTASYSGTVVIPESVTYNGKMYSVTSIGGRAFSGCTGLTSINIPNSVTSIGEQAFYGCSGMQKVIVPDIAAWCGILYRISFVYTPGTNPLDYAHHLYSNEDTEIADLIIPDGVTSISNYAFYGCTGLTSVTIPSSVTSIGNSAFYGCNGLTSVSIPSSVTSIGENALGGTAWYNNQSDGLVYVGEVAYKYKGTMTDGTEIVIKDGTREIAGKAFQDCTGLTSITIPESVTSIGQYAFYGCALTSVTIPESVTSIGNYTFSGCIDLTTVIIGSGVSYIGNYAFEKCKCLKDFYCLAEKVPENSNNIFGFDYQFLRNATLHVPAGSVAKYKGYYTWNQFGTIVALPEIKGDLNSDSKVDIADAVTVLNIMAEEEYNGATDINGDNKIDIADFVTILNIMASGSPNIVIAIILSEKSLSLQVNETKTISATILPTGASNKNVTWESSNENIATIDQTGKVNAIAEGSCIIICSATDGSGVKAECQVTVTSGTNPGKHVYVNLGLPSGTLWATCNIGANSPEEYGDYFAWGEISGYLNGKTTFSWSTYKYCNGSENTLTKYCINSSCGVFDNKTELEPEDDAATANWGDGWQMPSRDQFRELVENVNLTTKEWTTLNGVNGLKITSMSNGNSIFLPAVGVRDGASLLGAGNGGAYWSRTLTNDSNSASWLNINSGDMGTGTAHRYYGFSVRPVRK